MRYRSARTLVIHPLEKRYIVFNILAKTAFSAGSAILTVLDAFCSWQDDTSWSALFPGKSPRSIREQLEKLVDLRALISEDGPEASLEERYLTQWEWSLPSGLFHFGLQDIAYLPAGAAIEAQKQRAFHDPSPPLYLTHADHEGQICLPNHARTALDRVIRARRTCREAAEVPITLRQLADCLFAGLGIVGEAVTETGRLPLSTTPSGGARNPFEAYVLARAVEGLEPGFYHYSAKQHSLRRNVEQRAPKPSQLLGNQDWANTMPCIIFLVAFLERTMWKYSDSNAYRVVLIEAGHIGQNIMLAATAHGLSACPTAALSHSAINQSLGLTRLTQTALYALTLGIPDSPLRSR